MWYNENKPDCTENGRRHNSLRTFDVNVVHIFRAKPAVSRRVCMSKNLGRSMCFMAYISQIGMQNYIFAFSELEKNIVLQPSSFQDLRQKCSSHLCTFTVVMFVFLKVWAFNKYRTRCD